VLPHRIHFLPAVLQITVSVAARLGRMVFQMPRSGPPPQAGAGPLRVDSRHQARTASTRPRVLDAVGLPRLRPLRVPRPSRRRADRLTSRAIPATISQAAAPAANRIRQGGGKTGAAHRFAVDRIG